MALILAGSLLLGACSNQFGAGIADLPADENRYIEEIAARGPAAPAAAARPAATPADEKRKVLVYLAISRKLIDGAPANSLSSVPVMPWEKR